MSGPNLLDIIDNNSAGDWKPDEILPIPSEVKELALDTETSGLDWHGKAKPIGISYRRPDGFKHYYPFGHIGGNHQEEQVKRWAQRELRGKKLYGANMRFDVHMLREWGVDLEAQGCEFGDVQHYAALLDDSRRRFNLDALSLEYLGEGKIGLDLDGQRMAHYHASRVASRALGDVDQTFRLKEIMWDLMTDQGLHKVRDIEDRLIPVVCEMERNAAPINTELLSEWIKELDFRRGYCIRKIMREFSMSFEPNKSSDWEKLFAVRKIPIVHYTDKGAPSFTADNLRLIDDPWIQLALYADKLGSLRQKFLNAYDERIGNDGLLHYELHQLRSDEGGTVSGRFSSSKVNVQQVMTERNHLIAFGGIEKLAELFNDDVMRTWSREDFQVRKLFIPEDGLWLSADMSQVEYRVFAHYANSEAILRKFAEDPDVDFHSIVMELVKQAYENIDRKKAKDLNFAMVFGAGAAKIAEMLGVGSYEAGVITRAYHKMFPEAKELSKKATKTASGRGYVKTFFGRRARFPEKKFLHKALNRVVQGTAADLSKLKALEIHEARKETGFIFRFPVHDEFNGDSPDQRCTEMVTEILNRQTTELRVPLLWEVGTGENWAAAK